MSDGYGDSIALGSEVGLCNPLMLQWAMQLRRELPLHAIRVEVGDGAMLQSKLERGLLDAVLVYRPEYWAGMQVEQLLEEKLVQVSSTKNPDPYVYVDWGPDFRKQHDAAMPDKAKKVLSFNLGPLALQYLLQCGGTGYFRTRVVRRALERNFLQKVKSEPEFSYPVFLSIRGRRNQKRCSRHLIC